MCAQPSRIERNLLSEQLCSIEHMLDGGKLAGAVEQMEAIRQPHFHDPEYLRLQARIYDMRGRVNDAIRVIEQAVALRPSNALYHNTLAALLSHSHDYDAAINASRRAVELNPKLTVAWWNLGVELTQAVRYEEATAAFRRAAELEPNHPTIRARLADILCSQGRTSEAENAYREIIRGQPWSGSAWRGLADIKTVSLGVREVIRMRMALESPTPTNDDRIGIGYALAKALEDIGDYEGSLKTLACTKASAAQYKTWDPARFSRDITSILDSFSVPMEQIATRALGREVIFIVGLPRSGTTLVEQILASHHDVEGTGELTDLMVLMVQESRRAGSPFPTWVPTMCPKDWERLGRCYLERTARWRKRRPIFTDKLPSNWMLIGAIMRMLPSARVVCCQRDPVEVCFSNYRQYRSDVEYNGTFRNLATFLRGYERSVHFWAARYPDHVFVHKYEDLIESPKTTITRLLANCHLPWDAHCLSFYSTKRDVYTPSATQVREPLRRDTGRAARYGKLLDPLRAALRSS